MASYTGMGFVGTEQYKAAELKDFSTRLAGEEIGILTHAEGGTQHPQNPLQAFGIPVYIDTAAGGIDDAQYLKVKKVTTALATVKMFDGVTDTAAPSGDALTVRHRGEVWFPVGKGAIVAGDLAILDLNSTENSNGATAGDVISFDEASDAYSTGSSGDLADINNRLGGCVGRALTAGSARTSSTVFDIVKVRLRGF